jgi:hypothetical protein
MRPHSLAMRASRAPGHLSPLMPLRRSRRRRTAAATKREHCHRPKAVDAPNRHTRQRNGTPRLTPRRRWRAPRVRNAPQLSHVSSNRLSAVATPSYRQREPTLPRRRQPREIDSTWIDLVFGACGFQLRWSPVLAAALRCGLVFRAQVDGFRALVSTENEIRVRSRRGRGMIDALPEFRDSLAA